MHHVQTLLLLLTGATNDLESQRRTEGELPEPVMDVGD
jgi:hypothetical protein